MAYRLRDLSQAAVPLTPLWILTEGPRKRGARVLRASWEHSEKELMSTSFMSGSDPGGR